jgi:hypothetical protein
LHKNRADAQRQPFYVSLQVGDGNCWVKMR